MSRWIGWCLIVFLFAGYNAYGIKALPAYSVFYRTQQDEVKPYMELYWQIDPASVDFTKDEKGIWLARITTKLEVSNDTGVLFTQKYYLKTTPAASLLAAQLQNIMDLQRFSVTPGKVRIRLALWQEGQEKTTSQHFDSIEVAVPGRLAYSSIQLLDTAYRTTVTDNVFIKNGSLQLPMCMNFLDDFRKMLHSYTELYGTDKIAKEDAPLIQHIYISRKEYDYPIQGTASADTIKPAEVLPLLTSIKIGALPSGNYYLNFILKNNKGHELVKNAVFFQRSNTKPVIETDTQATDSLPLFEKVNVFDLSETFVGKYTIAQLKAITKMLRPIASEAERVNIDGFAKRPEETYMRYFVYNFWKSRTPVDPAKGWEDYTKLVREVNKMFGSKAKPGYETDRGYYYLKYGPPDQREIVMQEQGALPYEVWQYNAPGKQSSPGAFLFYNPGFMVTDYKLLHSTVQGEMRNGNWRGELYTGGVSMNSGSSKAEQIFMYK